MRQIFWGFCRNWFLISPLHYLSSHSDFGFESRRYSYSTSRYHRDGESATSRISDTGSRRLRVSVIRGVANSPHHWYAESPTPCITDTQSRRLPASPIRRVSYWIFEQKTLPIDDMERRRLPAPVIRWVADSPYRLRLRVSLIQRVDDSAYRWVRESTTPWIGDTGSRYSKKKFIWCRFAELLTAKPCL